MKRLTMSLFSRAVIKARTNVRAATMYIAGALVLIVVLLIAMHRAPPLAVHTTGSFIVNGEYPSSSAETVNTTRYGSWAGSDKNRGTLRTDAFPAPKALVMAYAGYPHNPGERIVLEAVGTRETLPFPGTARDDDDNWHFVYLPIPASWQGRSVDVYAVDDGGRYQGWLAVSGIRAARFDEIALRTPVVSRWSYIGFVDLGLLIAGIVLVLQRFPRPPFEWLYAAAGALIVAVAFGTGWTNVDLSGWFATWGREMLEFGPGGVYAAPAAPDNPPLNPMILGVPATIEALFHVTGAHADPFLFKLIPIGCLLALPLLVRAAVLSTGMDVGRLQFRWIIAVTALNPALIWSAVVWGQSDLYVSDTLLASFLGFVTARPGLGVSFFLAGVFAKPQPLLAVPLFAVMALRNVKRWQLFAGIAAGLALVLPSTFPHGGLVFGYRWLLHLFAHASNEYPFASMGAGTLPSLLSFTNGGLVDDKILFFGVSVHWLSVWSVLAAMCALAVGAWVEREDLDRRLGLWYLTASCMLIYWLATHMHERYITYGAVSCIAWAFVARNPLATLSAAALSLALLLQMLVNWPIDLGLGRPVDSIMLVAGTRPQYALVSAALNIAGLLLLLQSRPAGGVLRDRLQHFWSQMIRATP